MFKCPQCGAKNQPGALFCRSCGKKLDMENVEQQMEQQQHGFRGVDYKRIGRNVRRVIGILALLFIIAVGVGIFLPVETHVSASLPEQEEQAAYADLEAILESEVGTYNFTSEEVAVLANRLLVGRERAGAGEDDAGEEQEEEEGGFALKAQSIAFELLGSGYVRIVLHSTTWKGISIYSTVVGRFDVRGAQVEFLPHSAHCGRVRMPGPLKGIILDRFKLLVEGDPLVEALRKRIDFISVTRGQVDIDIEPQT